MTHREDLDTLVAHLGIELDPTLLQQALTHRSWHEENERPGHNERLEFLGDSVLLLVVTDLLFEVFSEQSEGVLSEIRSRLVGEPELASIGAEWELGPYLRLGRGEEGGGGRHNPRLIGNAVEAVVGALYRERGLEACQQLLRRTFQPRLKKIRDPGTFGKNPKSALQELTQKLWGTSPRYGRARKEGPPHDCVHRVSVAAGPEGEDRVVGHGAAPRIQDAQKAAAADALEQLQEQQS